MPVKKSLKLIEGISYQYLLSTQFFPSLFSCIENGHAHLYPGFFGDSRHRWLQDDCKHGLEPEII